MWRSTAARSAAWRITIRASGWAGRTWRAWAEAEIVLAADLGDGTDDPRATAPDLLRRALAALPHRVRATTTSMPIPRSPACSSASRPCGAP
jgi:hypothetical protein